VPSDRGSEKRILAKLRFPRAIEQRMQPSNLIRGVDGNSKKTHDDQE
jgi:hypothetical protein